MTTVAKPTFEPARGKRRKGGDLSQLSKQCSSRDLPSPTKIKYRRILRILLKRSKTVTSRESWQRERKRQVEKIEVIQLENEQLLPHCQGSLS
jgi:protein CWC15